MDPSVEVGPYAVVDEGVQVGPGCKIGPYVYLTGLTTIGANNQFFAGSVIGEAPQDLKYDGRPTRVQIGDNNVFREHVTVHRSTKAEEMTVIGSNNFLMEHSHVGHNSMVENFVILANGTLLGGYAKVASRAFLSGTCLVHQFVRVGTLALMQGGAAISKDLAPFTIARGYNRVCGLNTVGLRRAGMSLAERTELRKLYHAVFLSELNLRAAAAEAQEKFKAEASRVMLEFILSSKRGVCAHGGRGVDAEEE